MIELQQQGADIFFGEKSFEVEDPDADGQRWQGVINVLRVADLQDKPKLFSTFYAADAGRTLCRLPRRGEILG